MESVAQHLQDHAISIRTNHVESDKFGRSSFNRYYYAMFLEVRSLVTELNPSWSRTGHKGYPDLLRASIFNELKKMKKIALKIQDYKSVSAFETAQRAANNLANMMDTARGTRVTADYDPHIKVLFLHNNNFSLNSVSIKDAHSWPSKARTYTTAIKAAWEINNAN